MNSTQVMFLKELSKLLNKYNISEMMIVDEKITVMIDHDVLQFAAYIKKNTEEAYFDEIVTKQNIFPIEIAPDKSGAEDPKK